jgi:pimeloyl-ACP methyl ester carboxylesterase
VPAPRIEWIEVEGTRLYVEIRGSGPAVLLVHAGGEDAEEWRPIAERLDGFTVITYDRRGTLRSGRAGWPGRGSVQHADDAASLLRALQLSDTIVFGGSAGAIVALRLALLHPILVRCALLYEPGLFAHAPEGESVRRDADLALATHLDDRSGDWPGAAHAFGRAMARLATDSVARKDVLQPPPGREWYAAREDGNAEALVRDDIAVTTRERFDLFEVASSRVPLRFAYGTESLPIFRSIAAELAAAREQEPDRVEGGTHAIYLQPDVAADAIRRRAQDCDER